VYAPDPRGVDFVQDTLARLPAGATVTVLAEEFGKDYLYLRVRLADGRTGYMIWRPAVQYVPQRA